MQQFLLLLPAKVSAYTCKTSAHKMWMLESPAT
jgi:hypothetical protein